jgi:hypothetical protein
MKLAVQQRLYDALKRARCGTASARTATGRKCDEHRSRTGPSNNLQMRE